MIDAMLNDGGEVEIAGSTTKNEDGNSVRDKSDSEGSSSTSSIKTVASPPPVEDEAEVEELLPPALPRRSGRRSETSLGRPTRPKLPFDLSSSTSGDNRSAPIPSSSDFVGIPSPSPPPRKRRSESASRASRRDADEIDLSRLDALQRQSWVVNPKRSSMVAPQCAPKQQTPASVSQQNQNSALQTVVQDLVSRLRLLNEENFCLKRDLLRAKEREKHYREVEELALRQKMRSMEESFKTSLDEKRQLIRKLNANLSKISEKLGERDRALSELRREVSSLEKHWTQSRLDCEILQGKIKTMSADCSASEREISDLKAELREARQVSLSKSEGDKSELVELMRTVEMKNEETLAKLDKLMVAHTADVDLLSVARGESGCLVKAMESLVATMTNKERDMELVLEENARLKAQVAAKGLDPPLNGACKGGTKIRVDYPASQRDSLNVSGYKSLVAIGPTSPASTKSAPDAETKEVLLQREVEKLRQDLKASTSNSQASKPSVSSSLLLSTSALPVSASAASSSSFSHHRQHHHGASDSSRLRLVSAPRHNQHLLNRGSDVAENGGVESRLERELSQLRSLEPSNKRSPVRESELEVLRREIADIRTSPADSLGRRRHGDEPERKKSSEIIAIENDVADQLGKISQYVKAHHHWDADKGLTRPLSSPVIMSALLSAVDLKGKERFPDAGRHEADVSVDSSDGAIVLRLDGREIRGTADKRLARRSLSAVSDSTSSDDLRPAVVRSRSSVDRIEDPDCSLDDIDFDELSEMWTKELEFSFETLAAESSNGSD